MAEMIQVVVLLNWCMCGNVECVCCMNKDSVTNYEDFFHACIDYIQLSIAI